MLYVSILLTLTKVYSFNRPFKSRLFFNYCFNLLLNNVLAYIINKRKKGKWLVNWWSLSVNWIYQLHLSSHPFLPFCKTTWTRDSVTKCREEVCRQSEIRLHFYLQRTMMSLFSARHLKTWANYRYKHIIVNITPGQVLLLYIYMQQARCVHVYFVSVCVRVWDTERER